LLTLLGIVQAKVSVERIEKFLLGRELDPEAVRSDVGLKPRIVMEDATLTWDLSAKLDSYD
jgi:hypothetical protein